jgi:hypothetical protein
MMSVMSYRKLPPVLRYPDVCCTVVACGTSQNDRDCVSIDGVGIDWSLRYDFGP